MKDDVKTVVLNEDLEEIINCAVRYACGRRTYIVSNVCNFIKPLIPYMDKKWLVNIMRSIDMQRENPFCGDYNPLGDKCDIECWENLYKLIDKELEKKEYK